MIVNRLKLDEVDRQIIDLIQKKPNITHTEIAEKVGRSQPTVGIRVRKLEEQGMLNFQAGINIRDSKLSFAKVEIETDSPTNILDNVSCCPYVLTAFKLSGVANLSILLGCPDLEFLDKIVNHHFRNNDEIKSVSMDIITSVLNDLVLPMEFEFDKCHCDLKPECVKKWGNHQKKQI
ncbi:MAG: winged helix-turn-helix transcriptional regulator [Candidatus Lokiarchaeota archaeon]|nr:winged helix-turn-helix transcriptional regulator [Candidatus Lokiarchaeota archaeon]